MNEALEIKARGARVYWYAVQVELDDIVMCDKLGCDRAGYEVPIRILRMPNADVTVARQDALRGKDSIGCNELFDDRHYGRRLCLHSCEQRQL